MSSRKAFPSSSSTAERVRLRRMSLPALLRLAAKSIATDRHPTPLEGELLDRARKLEDT